MILVVVVIIYKRHHFICASRANVSYLKRVPKQKVFSNIFFFTNERPSAQKQKNLLATMRALQKSIYSVFLKLLLISTVPWRHSIARASCHMLAQDTAFLQPFHSMALLATHKQPFWMFLVMWEWPCSMFRYPTSSQIVILECEATRIDMVAWYHNSADTDRCIMWKLSLMQK